MREAVRQCQETSMQIGTDLQVVLECLYETYELEGEQLLLGKNIFATMVHPFLKMAEGQCQGIGMEEIHLLLWEVYQNSGKKSDFMREAGNVLESYRNREVRS